MNNYMKIVINAVKQWVSDGLNTKVDKVPGKGLSTEDFTSELKNKLESMTPGSGGSGSGSGGGVDVQNAVLYVEQTLNADQRAQARENIGVEEEIAESLLALEIVKTFGDEDGAIAEDGTVLVARNDELFLPPVNEENEGNVLTVVDGKWAVEPVEFAGGGGPANLQDLTFTGAVNAVYDGSRAVSVEIPEAPVKSVNGQTGDVTIELPEIDYPITSVNGMTGEVVIDVPSVDGLATEEYVNEAIGAIKFPDAPVTSVNGMTGDVIIAGGTGGNGSWNDLTEKPFYDIEPVCEPIYENATVSLTSSTDEQEVACLTGTLVEVEPNLTIAAGEKYKLQVNGTEYFGIAKNLPPIFPVPEFHEKKTGLVIEFHDNNKLRYIVALLEPLYYYKMGDRYFLWNDNINYNKIIFSSYDLELGETVVLSLDRVVEDAKKIEPKYIYGSDWNENDGTMPRYIKNRPFYKSQNIVEELIFDGKFVFYGKNSANRLPSPFNNFKDKFYIVEWDGVRYECRANYDRAANRDTITLGYETGIDSIVAPFELFASIYQGNGAIMADISNFQERGEVHRCKIYRKSQNWFFDQNYTYAIQPDWDENDQNSKNYIKNKLAHRELLAGKYLIEESDPTYTASTIGDEEVLVTSVAFSAQPVCSRTYSVRIGSNYASDLPYIESDVDIDYIGNRYLLSGDLDYNTGEPVLVVFNYPTHGKAYIITTYTEGGKIVVTGPAYEYTPIAESYLPSYFPRARQANVGDILVVAETGNTAGTYRVPTQWRATNIGTLIPPTDWSIIKNKPFGEIAEKLDEIFNQDLNFVDYINGIYVAELADGAIVNSINPGGTYVVNWDGEEYACTESIAEESGDQMVLGNMGIAMGQSGTGEPFCIMIMPGEGALIATTSSDSQHHLEIYNASLSVLHLDEKYIPNSVAKASTAQVGQTLIVKAIDENGKPTEWECVDMPTWIPNFTESDEGAVLKIVDGVPTWVSESNG